MPETSIMDLGRLANDDVIIKRKFRWDFTLIDTAGTFNGQIVVSPNSNEDGHFCKISSRPSISFNDQEVNHLIETVYLPARAKWDPIEITVWDLAGNDYLYEWLKAFYNPEIGIVNPVGEIITYKVGPGPVTSYPKKQARINMYDGHGETLETWSLIGCYPSSIKWGDLNYDIGDTADVTFTCRYDRAIFYNIYEDNHPDNAYP